MGKKLITPNKRKNKRNGRKKVIGKNANDKFVKQLGKELSQSAAAVRRQEQQIRQNYDSKITSLLTQYAKYTDFHYCRSNPVFKNARPNFWLSVDSGTPIQQAFNSLNSEFETCYKLATELGDIKREADRTKSNKEEDERPRYHPGRYF